MPSPETIKFALQKIFAGIKELKESLPGKEFTIDGRLVGDIIVTSPMYRNRELDANFYHYAFQPLLEIM